VRIVGAGSWRRAAIMRSIFWLVATTVEKLHALFRWKLGAVEVGAGKPGRPAVTIKTRAFYQ